MSYVIPILTFVLGVVLGVWGNYFVVRPKLVATGSTAGNDGRFATNAATITNVPGFFGINLEPTTIFGRTIHPRINWGLTADRYPANECTAFLYDEEGNPVTGLYWRYRDSLDHFDNVATIGPGQSVELMLFARLAGEPLRYFVFQPTVPLSTEPKVPADEVCFADSRRFVVRINYSYGRQKLELPAEVTKQYDGRLYHRIGQGGGSF